MGSDPLNTGGSRVWVHNLQTHRTSTSPCGGEAFSVALSPDGRTVACGLAGKVNIFKVSEGSLQQLTHGGPLNCTPEQALPVISLAFGRDGLLAAGGVDSAIVVYGPGLKNPICLVQPETDGRKWSTMVSLSFSHNSHSLAAARQFWQNGYSSTLLFKDALEGSKQGNAVVVLAKNAPSIMAFNKNDNYLVVGAFNQAQLYRTTNIESPTLNPIATIDAQAQIQGVAFDDSARVIVMRVIAYSNIIGTEKYKYDPADLVKTVCNLLPEKQRTLSRGELRKKGVATAGWLEFTPPEKLCP